MKNVNEDLSGGRCWLMCGFDILEVRCTLKVIVGMGSAPSFSTDINTVCLQCSNNGLWSGKLFINLSCEDAFDI